MLYLLYILSLLGFLILSALILRHLIRHGQLVPRFKWVVLIFGLFTLFTTGFSVYLLAQVERSPSSSSASSPTDRDLNTTSMSDLNF